MLNKKFIFIGAGALVLLLIVAIVVVSCGNKKTTTSTSNTLTIWGTEKSSDFDSIISSFQQKNSGYKITYVQKDAATYLNDSLSAIASGSGPDVWAVPNTWMVKYHADMVPMTTNLIANKSAKKSDVEVYQTLFPKVVVQDNVFNNNIYGMPLSIDTLVLFYNRTLLNKSLNDYFNAGGKDPDGTISQSFTAGPKSWDDLVTMTKILTKKSGGNITQSAIALGTANNIKESTDILTLIMLQDGAKMVSDDLSTAEFATAQNVFGGQSFPGTEALNFYCAFANPNNSLYTWNSSMTDSVHAFANGQTAMMIDYASTQADVTRINANLGFNYFAVPQVKETTNPVNYASYTDYTVTKASKNPTLAWQFINFMTNSTQSTAYFNKTNSQPAQLNTMSSNSAILPKQALTAESWYIPDPVLTPPIFANTVSQVNAGKDAQTAIEYAASQITDLLQKLKS